MSSPKVSSYFSPNSPHKVSKIFKDIITTPYERVLNILYDLKVYLSKKQDGEYFFKQLDWIISVISSHSLYNYQVNNSQNEIVQKYKKEIPEFNHFIEYLSEYNGQVDLVKKYSELINQTAQKLENKHSVSFEQLGLQLPSKNYKKTEGIISISRNSIFKRALSFNEVHKYFTKSKSEEKKPKIILKNNIRKRKKRSSVCYQIEDEKPEMNINNNSTNINNLNIINNNSNNSNIKIIDEIDDSNSDNDLNIDDQIFPIINLEKENPLIKKVKTLTHRRTQSTTKALDKLLLSPKMNMNLEPIFNFVELEKKLNNKKFKINQIMKPDFNIHELREIIGYNNVLPCVGEVIFHYFSLDEKIINIKKLDNFLTSISNKYFHNVLYHNAVHAADVTQNIATYIINSNIEEKAFTNINDILSLIVACLGHDIGHPGLNTNFLINSFDEKALTYNDNSPLENFHSAYLFKTLRNDDCNIFDKFSDLDFRTLRKRIISEILATDMAIHGKVLGVIKSKLINNPNKILISKDSKHIFEEQQSLFDFIVHCADIAHNAKLFHISLRWVELLTEEMWKQGDKEKNMKLPISFLCDRKNFDVPKSQVGFIKAFIIPTFEVLTDIFPSLYYLRQNAFNNLNKWDKLSKEKRKKGWSLEKRKNSFMLEEISSSSSFSDDDNDNDNNINNNNHNNNHNINNEDKFKKKNEKNDCLIINLLKK